MNDAFNHAITQNTGVDPANLVETYKTDGKPQTVRKTASDPTQYLPPEMLGNADLELPRKSGFEHRDPDQK